MQTTTVDNYICLTCKTIISASTEPKRCEQCGAKFFTKTLGKPTTVDKDIMNRVIHEFNEGQWIIIRHTEGGSIEALNYAESKSYQDLRKLCKLESELRKKKYHVAPLLKDYEYHYHSSWDALMPVVEKINALDGKYAINIDSDCVYLHRQYMKMRHFDNIKYGSKINAVHAAVYEFIVWFNSQTQIP